MDYGKVFLDVWHTLGSWYLVVAAYYVAYTFVSQMRENKQFWSVTLWNSRLGRFLAYPFFVFWVAVVSLALWAGYGTHTEDEDPLRGGGEPVTDFEPTAKERNEYGAQMFFELGIPALFAVYRHYKKSPIPDSQPTGTSEASK